jgi:glycerophosphoryl diester phosphodiesterase
MNYTDILQYDVGLIPHPKFPNQHKVAAVKPLLIDVIELIEIYTKVNNLPAYNTILKRNASPVQIIFFIQYQKNLLNC